MTRSTAGRCWACGTTRCPRCGHCTNPDCEFTTACDRPAEPRTRAARRRARAEASA